MTFPEKSQLQQKKLLETVQNACKIVDIHFFEKSLPVVRSLKYSLGWMQVFLGLKTFLKIWMNQVSKNIWLQSNQKN